MPHARARIHTHAQGTTHTYTFTHTHTPKEHRTRAARGDGGEGGVEQEGKTNEKLWETKIVLLTGFRGWDGYT